MNQRGEYVRGKDGRVTLQNVTFVKETANAVLVTVEGENHWFPFSQVHEMVRSPSKEGDCIVVSQWIAEKKGLV